MVELGGGWWGSNAEPSLYEDEIALMLVISCNIDGAATRVCRLSLS